MGRGMLVFKGDKKPKSKSKSKKKKKSSSETFVIASTASESNNDSNRGSVPAHASITPSDTTAHAKEEGKSSKPQMPQIQKGSGKIISSGTVITGISTKFRKEIASGDAIIIQQQSSSQDEMRVVTMCLSDTSCAISSAFSSDLKQPISFSYVRKPRNEQKEKEEAHKKKQEEWMETERTAFGTYGGGSLVYREKTETGSYVIKTEKLNQDVTRDDLLSMRAKKKSDRYC